MSVVEWTLWSLSIAGMVILGTLFLALAVHTIGNTLSDVMLRYQRLKFEQTVRNRDALDTALREMSE